MPVAEALTIKRKIPLGVGMYAAQGIQLLSWGRKSVKTEGTP